MKNTQTLKFAIACSVSLYGATAQAITVDSWNHLFFNELAHNDGFGSMQDMPQRECAYDDSPTIYLGKTSAGDARILDCKAKKLVTIPRDKACEHFNKIVNGKLTETSPSHFAIKRNRVGLRHFCFIS